MNWAKITNEEWREFQAIPEQGYSHRAWVDGAIRKRLDQLRTDEAVERVARGICRRNWPKDSDFEHCWRRYGDDFRADASAAIAALIREDA